jgi:hypothetical protein
MPYIRRIDGYDAAHAAHEGNALGGLNELVRDRSVPTDVATTILFWTTADDVQPGDEVLGGTVLLLDDDQLIANAAAFDKLVGPVFIASFEKKFIPDKQAYIARCDAEMQACDDEVDAAVAAMGGGAPQSKKARKIRPGFVSEGRRSNHAKLQEKRDRKAVWLAADEVELAAMKADVAAERSVRIERLLDENRAGDTMHEASGNAAALGMSVMAERGEQNRAPVAEDDPAVDAAFRATANG